MSRAYLVDTNVISAFAPSAAKSNPNIVAWMEANSERLYVSVVSIAEITDGISKLKREKATRKAKLLNDWLDAVLHLYASRILPVNIPTAQILGALSDEARAKGQKPGFADLAIAATAFEQGLTLLTRNFRHFAFRGLRVADPFQGLSTSQ